MLRSFIVRGGLEAHDARRKNGKARLLLPTRAAGVIDVNGFLAAIVVFAFERLDLALDKLVKIGQISLDICREIEILGRPLLCAA